MVLVLAQKLCRILQGGLLLLLAIGLCRTGAGCTSIERDLCEARCACSNCTDDDMDSCLANTNAEADTAAAYDCSEVYAEYVRCQLMMSRCRDNEFFLDGIDCSAELVELSECRLRGTSLD